MPEFHPAEDQAALYVMGGLTPDERREFKVRLAESAELRALVRELEDGAVALALASPRRLPPQKIWRQIERAVAGENRRPILIPLFSGSWWRNGWAAAAACLVGWLLYAFWPTHPATTAPPALAETGNHTQAETAPGLPAPSKTTEPGPAKPSDAEATRKLLQGSFRQIGDLRAQIAALESNDARLNQSVAQLQSLLGESNRLAFVQFKPVPSGDTSPAPAVNLSPDLQRALALAMARELGWAQSPDAPSGMESNGPGAQSLITISNVDFVDLRPGSNAVSSSTPSPPSPQPTSQPRPQPDEQAAQIPAQPAPTQPSQPSIPAFISGQNLIVAIDQAIAAKDSQVTFSYQTPDQGPVSLGTVNVGANPIVITVPMNFGGSIIYPGWSPITTVIATATGTSNTFQFFTPQVGSP